jgi:Flp pilus assembly protein CpaB
MQQTRSRTIVVAGVVVALLGAVMVFAYAKSVTGRIGGEATVSAFVATRDIPAGTTWESAKASMTQRSVPTTLKPASAVTSSTQMTGRTSVRGISKGEVVTTAQFGGVSSAPGAGLEIPPGHNAVTMSISPPQGVVHYVQKGDLVNIFVTLKQGDGALTKLLLSNVQVLANQPASTASSSEGVVGGGGEVILTLALTPDQAEKVIFSKENGSLYFGLVRPGDAPATTGGRTVQNVLN